MASIVFTAAADADAAVIFGDLDAKAATSTVVKYRASLSALYRSLQDFPDGGAPRPRIGADIRIGVVSPHIVIYRHSPAYDALTVPRIVHGRRRATGTRLPRAR